MRSIRPLVAGLGLVAVSLGTPVLATDDHQHAATPPAAQTGAPHDHAAMQAEHQGMQAMRERMMSASPAERQTMMAEQRSRMSQGMHAAPGQSGMHHHGMGHQAQPSPRAE
jgi:hypothetical protein